MSVYGICANPPQDSHILLLSGPGGESDKYGICNDFLARKKNLKEGEAALYNTLTGSWVLMKEDGTIDMKGHVNIEGTLHVTESITSEDEVTGGAVPVTLTGHTHLYNPGPGSPTQTGAGVG